MMDTVVLSNNVAKSLITALYHYYEQPNNSMTVGEMYLLLKLVVSKLEDEIEKIDANTNVTGNGWDNNNF